MQTIAWIFWAVNCLGSIGAIIYCSRLYNVNGVWGLATPGGWVWIWQLIGVALVPLTGLSPWHLLWWFPLGVVACIVLYRILRSLGIAHL